MELLPRFLMAAVVRIPASIGRAANILSLVVNDTGYGDPGVYGGGVAIGASTPNSDRLAHEALKPTSTYAQLICTPTRSAAGADRHPAHSGRGQRQEEPLVRKTQRGRDLQRGQLPHGADRKGHTGELPGMRPFEVGFDELQGYYASQKELTQQEDGR